MIRRGRRGDGRQTRSFMYIDDCVKGTQDIMASDVLAPVNLGSNELTTTTGSWTSSRTSPA